MIRLQLLYLYHCQLMGSCAGQKTNTRNKEHLQLAEQVFNYIDTKKQKKLTQENLTKHFTQYPEDCIKILMSQMDFDRDGKISRNEWFGYWEYIRLAGYKDSQIKKSLTKLKEGEVFLNYDRAKSYDSSVPRQTLIDRIVGKMKNQDLPIVLEK